MKRDYSRDEILSILLEYESDAPPFQELWSFAQKDPSLMELIKEVEQELDQSFRRIQKEISPSWEEVHKGQKLKSLVLEGSHLFRDMKHSRSSSGKGLPGKSKKNLFLWGTSAAASICLILVGAFFYFARPFPKKSLAPKNLFYCSNILGARGAYPAQPAPPRKIPGFQLIHISKRPCSCGKETFTLYEYRHLKTGMVFSYIPGGLYTMGSPKWSRISPPHAVHLKPFLISQLEVSRSVWKRIMGTSPWKGETLGEGDSLLPANYISWEMAKSFCRRTGLRLPTEEEWEFSAMGHLQSRYYWGDNMDAKYCWFDKNRLDGDSFGPKQVGQKAPNFFKLYDMLGNIAEWCENDWNIEGRSMKEFAVIRGGSWKDASPALEGRFRDYAPKKKGFVHIGFRLAFSVPLPKK
ncbi:MAG: hypothetical protein D6785_14380 [Planctomycetota bacterium]|nr:MAG: hypothetical protein D6785_14380 [Planctomycetota bacterium]